MKAVLLGLEFFINNLGCEALSYSFVNELYNVAQEKKQTLDLVTVVFADQKTPYIPNTDQKIRCVGIHYKKPSFWKEIKREFKSADLIVDFTMGDSFSDIYGVKRFTMDAMVKSAAIKSGTPYILGPQTYGPYRNRMVRNWAKKIIQQATLVYTRDITSQKVAEELSGREILLTTDVAFSLPYKKQQLEDNQKIKVGINPSGLLWNGGYTKDNQFGLTIDYQKYCWEICAYLAQNEQYEVYLLPHVGTCESAATGVENDLSVCKTIQQKYPQMHIVKNFNTPMELKAYISAMDVFIGARMHATIGAFSSGVATIPVSYSRKFEGLYDSLQYPYVIHALQYSTEEAVDKTKEYIANYKELQENVLGSMKIVKEKQSVFRDALSKLIDEMV